MTQEYTRPKHGMLHIYTGDGKGKTTSCIGLSVRSIGAGNRVLFIQFDKGPPDDSHYAERTMMMKFENLNLIPTGCDRFNSDGTFRFGMEDRDYEEGKRGIAEALKGLESGVYDLIVLDEIITAGSYGLVEKKDIESILDVWEARGKTCELVMSGRGAEDWLIIRADLVTEMKKIKHYFDRGFLARKGVEF